MRNGLGRALERGVRFGSLITVLLAVSSGGSADDLCPVGAACTIETGTIPDTPGIDETPGVDETKSTEPAGGARTPAAGPQLPLPLAEVAWSALMDRHDLIIGAIDAHHDDAYEYRLPYGEQVSYPVIQGYGAHLSHRGVEQYTVDFGMPVGTPVYAAREGVVALAEDSHDFGCPVEACGRLANFVVVLHSDGTTGEYFHVQRGSVQVRLGERVARGALLAFSGNTGYTTAPHLHFGVYRTERDGRTQSLAVSFATREGLIRELREGARYVNLPEASN